METKWTYEDCENEDCENEDCENEDCENEDCVVLTETHKDFSNNCLLKIASNQDLDTSQIKGLPGLKFFLDLGTDVNLTDKDGNTPLMLLFKNFHAFGDKDMVMKIFDFLLKAGADEKLKNNAGQNVFDLVEMINPGGEYDRYNTFFNEIDSSISRHYLAAGFIDKYRAGVQIKQDSSNYPIETEMVDWKYDITPSIATRLDEIRFSPEKTMYEALENLTRACYENMKLKFTELLNYGRCYEYFDEEKRREKWFAGDPPHRYVVDDLVLDPHYYAPYDRNLTFYPCPVDAYSVDARNWTFYPCPDIITYLYDRFVMRQYPLMLEDFLERFSEKHPEYDDGYPGFEKKDRYLDYIRENAIRPSIRNAAKNARLSPKFQIV